MGDSEERAEAEESNRVVHDASDLNSEPKSEPENNPNLDNEEDPIPSNRE